MTRSQRVALALSPGHFRRWLSYGRSGIAEGASRIEDYLSEVVSMEGIFMVEPQVKLIYEQLPMSMVSKSMHASGTFVKMPRWVYLFCRTCERQKAIKILHQLRILRLIHQYEYDNKRNNKRRANHGSQR